MYQSFFNILTALSVCITVQCGIQCFSLINEKNLDIFSKNKKRTHLFIHKTNITVQIFFRSTLLICWNYCSKLFSTDYRVISGQRYNDGLLTRYSFFNTVWIMKLNIKEINPSSAGQWNTVLCYFEKVCDVHY